jgi:hypothetical protein
VITFWFVVLLPVVAFAATMAATEFARARRK